MIIIDKITDNIILVFKSVLHIYSRVNTFFQWGVEGTAALTCY